MSPISDSVSPASRILPSYDLGIASYSATQELQIRLRRAVIEGDSPGALLLLEHSPVITLGAHASMDDLLDSAKAADRHVDVVRSERGGQVTLHAPGQLVVYPVLRIPRRDLRGYVYNLEEVLLRTLRQTGLRAHRIPTRPGLFIGNSKIASLGLRCEHGVASHGSSLNIDVDLSLFDLITSCGEPGLRQTSVVNESGRSVSMRSVKEQYLAVFSQVFDIPLAPVQMKTCEEMYAALI